MANKKTTSGPESMTHKGLAFGCIIGLAIGLLLAFTIGSGSTTDYLIESVMLYGGGGLFIGSFIGLKIDEHIYKKNEKTAE